MEELTVVNIHIFHSVSAGNLLAGQQLPPEASGLGVYFHLYENADRPFYIGISDDMAGRNRKHLENYQKKRYWLVKNPHRLTDLRCFVKDAFYSTYDFYKPEYVLRAVRGVGQGCGSTFCAYDHLVFPCHAAGGRSGDPTISRRGPPHCGAGGAAAAGQHGPKPEPLPGLDWPHRKQPGRRTGRRRAPALIHLRQQRIPSDGREGAAVSINILPFLAYQIFPEHSGIPEACFENCHG